MEKSYIGLIVPKKHVKNVKNALEEHKRLDRSRKITHYYANTFVKGLEPMFVPTTFPSSLLLDLSKEERVILVLSELGLESLADSISIFGAPRSIAQGQAAIKNSNPFIRAVQKSLLSLPPDCLQHLDDTVDSVVSKLPTSYSLYEPLLLLPNLTFTGLGWERLFSNATNDQILQFYGSIASSMNVTHIAVNAPIPRLDAIEEEDGSPTENILRSPINLTLLFGEFGPNVSSIEPTRANFDSALWVSTRQNGINQVWAPQYTMFSRGNITEKARVLNLSSVQTAVEQGVTDGQKCAAVDLYAGIGYFAFSYAKAGVEKVYCWELNPWSVEGFKRGVERNKWGVSIVDKETSSDGISLGDSLSTFVLFNMDNRRAMPIIERSRALLPPIRHVNCGLLPTSKGSWETAVRIIDPELGGWVHLHENIATKDIEAKSVKILEEIQDLIDRTVSQESEARGKRKLAILEHVEKVKTYAPGVVHCVLDIYISNITLKN
jgi:tRNA wybutosine-synthesizing protein 2